MNEGWAEKYNNDSFVVTDVDFKLMSSEDIKCEPETQGYEVLDRTERKNRPKRETERPIIERLGQRSWRKTTVKREITLPLEDSFQGTGARAPLARHAWMKSPNEFEPESKRNGRCICNNLGMIAMMMSLGGEGLSYINQFELRA